MHIPKHSRVRRLNPICQPNRQPNTEQFQGDSIPSVNPTRSERNRTEEKTTETRTCERRRIDGISTSVFNALIRELLPPPRSWRLERGLTRAHHRIIGTMQAHLRSCTVPENNSWLWWMLTVRCDFGSHRRERLRCFCNSCGCFCNSCRCFCNSCGCSRDPQHRHRRRRHGR